MVELQEKCKIYVDINESGDCVFNISPQYSDKNKLNVIYSYYLIFTKNVAIAKVVDWMNIILNRNKDELVSLFNPEEIFKRFCELANINICTCPSVVKILV